MTSLRWTVPVAAVAVLLALAPVASAGAKYDRVTGGGQVAVGTNDTSNPTTAGDNISFVARRYGASLFDTKGQTQYVDRTAAGNVTRHGVVTCLNVQSAQNATFAGVWGDGTFFKINVTDNGQGAGSNADMIAIDVDSGDDDCSTFDGSNNPNMALARGNAQIY